MTPQMSSTPQSDHAPASAEPEWASLTDEQLLERRICDLKVRIPGSELESRIQTLYRELDDRKIAFKPVCYLGDEWFCPEGAAAIAIPFYLAHPRLKKLEERMMMEVEGSTEIWCLRLLRHEMGHVMNHAYLLEKRPEWQKVFGSASIDYSEYYRARPYSKRFVRHLEDWYAQSHPEEDFAETFAIWVVVAVALAELLKNVVYEPIILGGAVKLHPLVVVIGVLGGAILFGPAGMLLAIPTITIVKVLVASTARHLTAYGLI